MRPIYVPLPADAHDLLRELARRELRDPRDQASWLILDGLRRAGLPAVEVFVFTMADGTRRATGVACNRSGPCVGVGSYPTN